MSKIEEEGFISKESEEGRVYLVSKYEDFFKFSRELNKVCMKFLISMRVDWENDYKLITQTLYLRIVEGFQSIYLMLERGIMPAAKILVRSLLEASFMLIALQKRPDLISSYLDKHEKTHLNVLKSALKFKSDGLRSSAKKNGLQNLYVEKQHKLKDRTLNILKPIDWAKEAELDDFYNLYYVTYCNSTHSNMAALDDHVDNSSDEINLSTGPSDIDLYDVFKCAVYVLVNSTNSIGMIFENNMKGELDKFVNRIPEFDRKYLDTEI